MELVDLFRTLRRRWIVALAAAWIVLAIGMYAVVSQDEKYEAAASIIVTPSPAAAGVPQQSVFVVQNSMPALEARLESRTFHATAIATVPEEYRGHAVTVKPESDPGTGLFNIIAQSDDVEAVAPWANAFAAELIASNPYTTITLEPLDPAVEPDSAESTVETPTLVALIVLAAIVGVLAALAANALSRRDPSAELRRRYGVDVIGEIPADRRLRSSSGALNPAELFGSDAHPRLMESFQSLRAEVEILIHSRGLETLAVTSALPGEGKSTVSANLAWALASVGHKVTLIDCDLRNPAQHATFGYSRFSVGVSDVLETEESDLADLARGVGLPGLALVPSGVPSRHPAEILGPSLGKLIPEFTGPDRLVLIDSPPLEGVAESRTIVAAAHAIVLVIDARRRRDSEEIERALQIISSSGAMVVGLVLNRARVRRAKETSRYIVPKPRLEATKKKAKAAPSNLTS